MTEEPNAIYLQLSYNGKTYKKWFKVDKNLHHDIEIIMCGMITTLKSIDVIKTKQSAQVYLANMFGGTVIDYSKIMEE